MKSILKHKLIKLAQNKISNSDVSHDFQHTKRVLANAEKIAEAEKADLDIVIPSALFHDLIVYQKNHPKKELSQIESADKAEILLRKLEGYPKNKISDVKTCILECSFSKGVTPESLESKVLQDADGLEATGAISIMRTYASTGQMQRPFYNPEDPFCKDRKPETLKYALDLFYERLLVVSDRMHTVTGKKIAERRTRFLNVFIKELSKELKGE